MRIKFGEIEFTGKQEDDRADRGEPAITPRLAFNRLKQSLDRFQKTVGLARLRPGDDAFEMVADHLGYFLHRFDLGRTTLVHHC